MIELFGEAILARTIQATDVRDKSRNAWQYHSRSDRHSKAACWAITFDLMRICPLLRTHAAQKKVGFGINHELRDFQNGKKKDLDLVLSVGAVAASEPTTLETYGREVGIVLEPREIAELADLPELHRGEVSNVLMALEAKACMTAHVRALPRLFSELDSSHQTIHGDTNGAIAGGFVMINTSSEFVSSDLNKGRLRPGKAIVSKHKQPADALRTLNTIKELPRRSDERGRGFDAIGVTMIECRNDGSPVAIDAALNAQVDPYLRYEELVKRLAHLYATKFAGI